MKTNKGFTLVEVLVAIVILVVGIFALAKTMAIVTYLVGLSSRQTAADVHTRGVYEEQFALGCASRVNGVQILNRGSATAAVTSWQWVPRTATAQAEALPVLNNNIHNLIIVTTYPVSANKFRTDTFEVEVICVK